MAAGDFAGRHPLAIVSILCSITMGGLAQPISLAGPDPGTVKVGARSVIVLSVEGHPRDVQLGPLPRVDGLRFLAGGAQGKTDASGERTTWEIAVIPEREGVFALPPLSVDLMGVTLTADPGSLEAVRDLEAEAIAFVEVRVPEGASYVGEAVVLVLRVGLQADLLRERLVPLFPRRLDVPVQVEAPWLSEQTRPLVDPRHVEQGRRTFVLDLAVVSGVLGDEETLGGRSFAVIEHERVLIAGAPGELSIPPPGLRFAHATRFEEGFLGRRPLDRHDGFVLGRPGVLRVRPLPEDGRPRDFRGAVGRFTVRAEVPMPEVDVGKTLSLYVHVEGEGNLGSIVAPDPEGLEGFEGFHVLGMVEGTPDGATVRSGSRTFRYDLAALDAGVLRVPSLPFSFFDPAEGAGYRTVFTDALPIRVRSTGGDPNRDPRLARQETGLVPGRNDLYDIRTGSDHAAEGRLRLPAGLVAGLLMLPWALAAGALVWLRVKKRRALDPEMERARAAADTYRGASLDPDADPAQVFSEFLAARLRCPPAAVIAPDLDARLVAAGIPGPLAREASALLERMVAVGYGGRMDPRDREAARGIVDAIERARAPDGKGAMILLLLCAVGQPSADPFVEGAIHYRAERYAEATRAFEEALGTAVPDGVVLYNLGNCSYRRGRFAEAVVFYRRALLRRPDDGECAFNLRLAEQHLGIHVPEGSEAGGGILGGSLVPLLGWSVTLQSLGLLCWVLCFRGRLGRRVAIVLLVIGTAGASLVVQRQWWPADPYAVVLVDRVSVRVEPADDAASSGELWAGRTVSVAALNDSWARVRTEDTEGWMRRDGLGLID